MKASPSTKIRNCHLFAKKVMDAQKKQLSVSLTNDVTFDGIFGHVATV